ncbi:hypothetical protein [Micromonospora sagamiensis]|uniref:Uncharacterized protein n=1 Tax=Micromonospora sagamiensis TaxID=47875 RepID=A0A562WJ89_9ACTN|nr:hypothetical protein [Micromonospora sagamiensis]TWJ29604.1 hypothetical protein JD81_03115 [Micromonospora sagamiensis]BCL17367.1 hypothetical protein GCM10017556_51060 [Micromonospora sagamiensis]
MFRPLRTAFAGLVAALALALVAAPAGAAPRTDAGSDNPAQVLDNGCVRTTVGRSGQTVYWVMVQNICGHTLYNVDAHVFNGPAGVDYRSQRGTVNPNGFIMFDWRPGSWYAPPGSLTCGELWTPGPTLQGRDCITM